MKVTFTPPVEPNGNITAYYVYIYEKGQLVKNISLNIIQNDQNMMTAVIEGLKGGHNYSIQVEKQLPCFSGNQLIAACPHVLICPLADFSQERSW